MIDWFGVLVCKDRYSLTPNQNSDRRLIILLTVPLLESHQQSVLDCQPWSYVWEYFTISPSQRHIADIDRRFSVIFKRDAGTFKTFMTALAKGTPSRHWSTASIFWSQLAMIKIDIIENRHALSRNLISKYSRQAGFDCFQIVLTMRLGTIALASFSEMEGVKDDTSPLVSPYQFRFLQRHRLIITMSSGIEDHRLHIFLQMYLNLALVRMVRSSNWK